MVRWSCGLASLQIIFLAGVGAAPVCSSNNTVTFASCQPQVSRKACCCHHCWHVDVLAGGLLSLTEAICMPGRVSDSPTASASCPSAVPSAPPGPMARSCCTLSLLLLASALTEHKPRRCCSVALEHGVSQGSMLGSFEYVKGTFTYMFEMPCFSTTVLLPTPYGYFLKIRHGQM